MLIELQEKRTQILRVAHRHGAKSVRVFGSYARGDERPESDVDFLVDMKTSRCTFVRFFVFICNSVILSHLFLPFGNIIYLISRKSRIYYRTGILCA